MPSLRSTFPCDLRADFLNATPPGSPGEVALFRALQTAFAQLGQKYYVEEFHGARSRVRFAPTSPWRPNAGRCELSDLLIVTYQRTPVIDARFTFLQCKRDSRAAFHSLRGGASTRGNYEQWDLLHHRPLISPVGSVRPPADVLRSAALASVGSFGVFTRGDPGWDMVYVAADSLAPPPGRVSHEGPLQLAHQLADRTVSGYTEAVHACCLPIFGHALESVTIGTPLFAAPRSTQAWLAGVLRTVGANQGIASRAAELGQVILTRLESATRDNELLSTAPNTVVVVVENGGVPRRNEAAG